MDLVDFREQARKSRVVAPRGPLKRTKDTSGSVVSPDTAKARPQPKRLSSVGRRLEFKEGSSAEGELQHVQQCT